MNSTTFNDAPRLIASDVVTEGFILLAMALVTLALGSGLYLQFDLSFVAAMICALSVYLGLLATHALVHRNSAVTALQTELKNLEQQFARVRRRTGDHGSAQPPSSNHETSPGSPFDLPASDSAGISYIPTKDQPNTTTPDLVLPPDLVVPSELARQSVLTDDHGTAQGTVNDQLSVSEDDVPTVPIFDPPMAPVAAKKMPTSIASQRQQPKDSTQDQQNPPPAPASSRPPREADVEMIHGLIKKLADEVNATTHASEPTKDELAHAPDVLPADVMPEKKSRPKPLAKQSMDSSPTDIPVGLAAEKQASGVQDHSDTTKPTDETSALTRKELSSPADERSPTPVPKKKTSGPISIASQVIAQKVMDAGNQSNSELTGEATTQDDEADNPQSAADSAIEASVDALRSTAKAMRGDDNDQQPSVVTGDSKSESVIDSGHNQPIEFANPNAENRDSELGEIIGTATPSLQNEGLLDDGDLRQGVSLVGSEEPLIVEHPATETQTKAPSEPGIFAIISEALNAGRVDVLLDPILGLDNRRARHFEISVRLRDIDNSTIDTHTHRENFAGTGLETMLDRATLSRTATVALQLDSRGRHGAVFSKVAAESFAAEEFIDDVYAAFQQRSDLSSQLVMTLTQEHVRRLGHREWTTLTDLKTIGFRFAVSSVTDLDMDFEDLSEKGFTFVKLDADVFLNGLPAGQVRIPANDICNHLDSMDITAIVDSIEDDEVLKQLKDHGVQFGQGQLFGGPRTVKAQALKSATGNAA